MSQYMVSDSHVIEVVKIIVSTPVSEQSKIFQKTMLEFSIENISDSFVKIKTVAKRTKQTYNIGLWLRKSELNDYRPVSEEEAIKIAKIWKMEQVLDQ